MARGGRGAQLTDPTGQSTSVQITGDARPLLGDFRIAVIGAGIAGLACAQQLIARGGKVTVFEQGRRPGGRASTLRTELGNFDHGAPYFTVQSHALERAVAQWLQAGVAKRYAGQVIAVNGAAVEDKTEASARFAGADGMISIARHMGEDIEVRLDTRIDSLVKIGSRWSLLDASERSPVTGGFDAVVLAMPSAQAAQLAGVPPTLVQHLRMVEWRPCWAALLTMHVASGFDFAGCFVGDHAALAWVARSVNESGQEQWVLHATPDWSISHLNMPSEEIASLLAQALAERFNFGFRPAFIAGHRWAYATPARPLLERFLWDSTSRIGAVGDWCQGPRFEGAFLSGASLGMAIAL